jgi:DNA repair photolyase
VGAHWVLLRLPPPVDRLVDDWLATHYSDRRERVLNRIRSTRGGRTSDPRFGVRQRGQGEHARQIAALFDVAARKHRLHRALPPLRTDAFRRPAQPGDQLTLL